MDLSVHSNCLKKEICQSRIPHPAKLHFSDEAKHFPQQEEAEEINHR